MDQDIEIINQNTRIEKIKNFFLNNSKKIIIISAAIIIIIFGYFILLDVKKNKRYKIAENYNQILAKYDIDKNENFKNKLIEIVNKKDPTYSPLALYFLIDNKVIEDKGKINELFDLLINKTKLNKEIKNLVIYKKALYNSDNFNENQLLNLLKPIINSENVWKSHSLYLLAEYFYSKNQKEKSKEFYIEIINLEESNINIKLEAQKKLNRDFKWSFF